MRNLLTNHPLVNVLFLVVVLMGAFSYFQMPREQDPEISFNWVVVQISLPGASAIDVEQLVTSPIEDALRQVQDVRMVSSSSREGLSNILVRFHELNERDFDKRLADLRREVQNKANDELPDNAEDPDIREITTSNGFPTVLVVVAGQARDEALRREARLVRDEIERIAGVDKVDTLGLADPELIIELDPDRLSQNGISASEVADNLRTAFQNIFAGSTQVAGQEWLVRIQNTSEDPSVLADFPLASRLNPEQSLRLGDVAKVYRGTEDPFQLVSINNRPAISLAVSKIAYTNTIDLVDTIRGYIESRNDLVSDQGFEIILADDQTVPTRSALSVMQTNAVLGLLLVLLVSWLFLGLKIAGLVTLGLVFSIAGTFWVLDATQNTLNVSVLLGVVIVLGMLVDDAVVVVEAVYYRLIRGQDALDSALGALAEVAKPVTSAVSTTVSAFLPLMLLPGIVGDFMFIIPFVVAIGLAVSLVEAFWVLPAHVIALKNPIDDTHRAEREHWRSRFTRLLRLRYTRLLVKVLRSPGPLITACAAAFVLAVSAVAFGVIKTNFFAADPLRIFYISLNMDPDASLEDTLAATQTVEKRVQSVLIDGEARAVTVLAGVRFTETEMLIGDQYGQIQVSLNPATRNSRSIDDLVSDLRGPVLASPVNADISFLQLSGGPPVEPAINVKLMGDDLAELRRATDAMLVRVSNIDGARDVADDEVPGRQELVIDLDELAVRDAGLDPGSVSRLLRLHMDGEIVSFVRSRGEKLEVRVRGPVRNLNSIQSVLDDDIVLPDGSLRSFRTLVKSSTKRGAGVVKRYSFKRTLTIRGDIDTDVTDTLTANNKLTEEWKAIRSQFPGVEIHTAGALSDITESLDAMLGLFLMGIGFIYLILATQFRSYFQPLLILLTVPMAFTGVVFGLLMTGHALSLWTLYGVVALTGIAVNAAIVLIDAANARIKAGMRPLHATVYAARRRVIPILMTTMTTIAGLFSLAVGLGGKSLVWGPVAASIVAGLLVASALTLFMLPVLYRLFMRKKSPADMASRA